MIKNKTDYFAKLKKISNILLFFNKKLRHKVRNYLNTKIIEITKTELTEKYPNDYLIFSRNGVGDIFFTASLIKEFKKTHPGKVIYITEKPKLENYIKTFKSIDEVIVNKNLDILQSEAPFQSQIRKGHLNFLYFPYRGKKKNYVFADSYANLLGVALDAQRELPLISPENIINAETEIKKLNIEPSKTIILIPEAVMFDHNKVKPKTWKKLADELKNKGYDVVFNSSNRAYKKYKTTFLPVMDFIALAKQVKHIVSFRSGICDVLAGVGIYNLTAVYPENLDVIWTNKFLFDELLNKYHEKTKDDEFENIFHIYSLNSNFKVNNISEIILDGNEKHLIQEVLHSIKIDKPSEYAYN